MAQNVIINGVTYAAVPEVDIPLAGGGTARFVDTADADATGAEIVAGKTAYVAGAKVAGSMADNGAVGGTISTVAGTVVIPAGRTSGGTVSIAPAEQAKVVPSAIKSGVTLLGVAGSLTLPTISQDSSTKVLSIS